jgi:sugar lactone lactonase YvrE
MSDEHFPDADVEVILEPRARVGEGPTWDERSNTLVWVDIMGHSVHIYDPVTGHDRSVDVGQPVGAAVLREGGGLALALRDGFGLLDAELDNLRMVASVEADVPTNRMNDGKCDAAGRFWAGTMPFEDVPGAGALYRMDATYQVRRMLTGVNLSNGLDWSADNQTMFYVDSTTHGIDTFDFDLDRGLLGERRRLISIPPEVGLPDGMTVDAEGGIWVALHGAGKVHRYLPDGSLDRVIRVPTPMVTCPAFGGIDLGDLYITSMTYGMSAREMEEQPLAGALFRCRPGVKGKLPNRFLG